MPITERPAAFVASDGSHHPTKVDAERHETLLNARTAYISAHAAFARALAATCKTADGKPFEFSIMNDYYAVSGGYPGMPRLETLSFGYGDFEFDGRDDLCLILRSERERQTPARRFRISELFRSKAAAERALLAEQETWLRERQQDLAELRTRLVPAALTRGES